MLSSWASTMRILYRGLRSLVFAEEPLDLCDHRSRLAGLGEIAVATDLHRFFAIRCESVRGQRDDGNPLRRRIMLQHLRRLPAINDRDGYVHQNQIWLFRPGFGYAFLAIERFSYLVTEMLQDGGIDYTIVLVVFHQQYHFT